MAVYTDTPLTPQAPQRYYRVTTSYPTRTYEDRRISFRWNTDNEDVSDYADLLATIGSTDHVRPTVALIGSDATRILQILESDIVERITLDDDNNVWGPIVAGEYFIEAITESAEAGRPLRATLTLLDETLVEATYST